MALTPAQQQVARTLIGLGEQHGLSPTRAAEFAAAAFAESSLNPSARNASGAAGLFQLLSPGYVTKANALGGVMDPHANALAILPDYLNYWRQNPNAAPGAAASAVERSGEGPGFYAAPLSLLGGLSGSAPPSPPRPRQVSPSVPVGIPVRPTVPLPTTGKGLSPNVFALLNQGNELVGLPSLPAALAGSTASSATKAVRPAAAAVPPAAAATPRTTAVKPPKITGPSLRYIEHVAAPFGLTITSTTGGQHAKNSYHYRGRAVDFGGNPKNMAALANYALQHPAQFTEMFYTGPGHPNYFISDGKVLPLSQLDPGLYKEHENHVHLAR